MAWSAGWKAAKKTASSAFKEAYKKFDLEVQKSLLIGDKELAKRALAGKFTEMGMEQGKNDFQMYMKFPDGLSGALDKLEASAAKKDKARKPDVIKAERTKVRNILVKYGQQVGHYRVAWKKFMGSTDFCKPLLDAMEKIATDMEAATKDVK